ncbi:MAG: DUF4255 domain-containing protein [Pirellulales bacterium]|nr:DUF4255 domain-containing protein [Pirellulales bacterium]
MSNALAIASVTATLRHRLQSAVQQLANVTVSVQPPNQITGPDLRNRLNLYLYQTAPSAAWRNENLPGTTKAGERGHPPLAINLYYLLTAYGEDGIDADISAHQLLGAGMRVLHDTPQLREADIAQAATLLAPPLSQDLDRQVERVKLTPVTLSVEEMSKLWSTFQAPYRISAAYEASVVLIESQRPPRAALPVLRRGAADSGVDMSAGFGPVLQAVEYRPDPLAPLMPSAVPGEQITIIGSDLSSESIEVLVRDPHRRPTLADPEGDVVARLVADSTASTATRMVVPLTRDGIDWMTGIFQLELAQREPATIEPGQPDAEGATRLRTLGNPLPLLISPVIARDSSNRPLITQLVDDGQRRLEVTLVDSIPPRHQASLVLTAAVGNAAYQLPRLPGIAELAESNPRFDISRVPPGEYWVRLRVDGADSRLFTKVETNVGGRKSSVWGFDRKFILGIV